MPEYLAPGVYVEETSFRSKSIEGVSTTTTGLIGPTRYGPVDLEPEIITSVGEFELTYGDRQQLRFKDQDPMHNWMWHAVRAFFEEGGRRLYVARVYRPDPDDPSQGFARSVLPPTLTLPATLPPDQTFEDVLPQALHFRARFQGLPGNARVRLTLSLGQNVLSGVRVVPEAPLTPIVRSLQPSDIVWVSDVTSPISSPPGSGDFYIADRITDATTKEVTWRFRRPVSGPDIVIPLSALSPAPDSRSPGDIVKVVTLTVTVEPSDDSGFTRVWENLPLDPGHKLGSMPDSVFDKFTPHPANLNQARTLPIVITPGVSIGNGLDVLEVLLNSRAELLRNLITDDATAVERSVDLELSGQTNDGLRPESLEYAGTDDPRATFKTGLKTFEDLEDISIVAAPGATFGFENGFHSEASTINNLLISHCTRMRYRIAVLDSGDGQSISQVRSMRAKVDSSYAALYYPWIRVLDPVTRQEIHVPPCGHVAGIYARNDINRAVYKAPANEVVNLAIGFEVLLNRAQQEVLNPEGINCFRFFEGRGFRLWGARTISSDPEWKYVNLRRYFAYLERSIDRGTQWAVFEPNGEQLWANVRQTISEFLFNEWFNGALLGEKADKAFFVKCDRSTMTQNDLDNGRLICLIGVAPLRPAEFVIFRIGQWTADRKV